MITLDPLGDRGFLAQFATEGQARGWADSARRSAIPGVVDIVLAYRSVGVFTGPDEVDLDALERELREHVAERSSEEVGCLLRIPVLYDGEDLSIVAEWLGLSEDLVIAMHADREYRVLAMGFMPGFPYTGDLAPELAGLPRRDHPRARVPAGSVAIAGRQTGVYPAESPGGWHLLGRTPLVIVDVERDHFPIRTGDRIRFFPIEECEYRARKGEWLARPESDAAG